MARRPQSPIPPSGTSQLFARTKPTERSADITRESLARDLAAFRKTGGKIEVLGNTRTLSSSEERAARTQRTATAAASRTSAKADA
jgi:hypothetical protein